MTRTRTLPFLAALAALILAVPAAARAQSSSLELSLGAGLALPTSTFGDANDAGYALVVGVGSMPRGSQMGFRAEGLYTEYTATGTSRKSHAGGLIGNVVFDLTQGNRTTTNSLYLLGGLGYYQTREEFRVGTTGNESNIGWNIGGGFRFPLSGFSGAIEARYHTVQNTDVKFIPITFSVVF